MISSISCNRACNNSFFVPTKPSVCLTLVRITQGFCYFLICLLNGNTTYVRNCWFNEPQGSGSGRPQWRFSMLKYLNSTMFMKIIILLQRRKTFNGKTFKVGKKPWKFSPLNVLPYMVFSLLSVTTRIQSQLFHLCVDDGFYKIQSQMLQIL